MPLQRLIDDLNEDLAFEWGAVIRYSYHAALSTGVAGGKVREALGNEIQNELSHARYLADTIVALGGTPTLVPKGFARSNDLASMLEYDLKSELDNAKRFMERATPASNLGYSEIGNKLEEIAEEELRHGRDLRKLIEALE